MKTRIGQHGLCEVDSPHPGHVYPLGMIDNAGNVVLGECPGQYSHCRNCDDRGCMGCVFREYYHDCKWDCPFCNEGDAAYLVALFEDEAMSHPDDY